MAGVLDDPVLSKAVQADFEAGILSLREIASAHSKPGKSFSHVTLKHHADAVGWTRSLKARIQRAAESKAQHQIAREQDSKLTEATERQVIEANAERIAQVRTTHRRSAARLIKITEAQLQQLEAMSPEEQLIAYKVSKSIADQLRAAVEIESGTYGFSKDTPEQPPQDDDQVDLQELARGMAFMLTRAVISKAKESV